MTEEESTEETSEETEESSEEKAEGEEVAPAAPLVDKAEKAADEIKEVNKRLERNLKWLEALKIETTLGGSSEAGLGQVKKEEISDEQFANDFMEGKLGNVLLPEEK